MTDRMFAAILLPDRIRDQLDRMVEPRRDEQWRWTRPETWHVTLAFYAEVEPWRYEPLVERLTRAAARAAAFPTGIEGVGAFPAAAPDRAKVLYAAVNDPAGAVAHLHSLSRAAASTAGIAVASETYVPHVTLARSSRPVAATRLLRALAGTYTDPWQVDEIALVQSHLGAGPPRYEVRERFRLGARTRG